jgi:hypothetical protein
MIAKLIVLLRAGMGAYGRGKGRMQAALVLWWLAFKFTKKIKIAKCLAEVIIQKKKSRPNNLSRFYFCFFFSGSAKSS